MSKVLIVCATLAMVAGVAIGISRDEEYLRAKEKVGERQIELVATTDDVLRYSAYLPYEFIESPVNGRLFVLAPRLERSLARKMKNEWASAAFYRDTRDEKSRISRQEFESAFRAPDLGPKKHENAYDSKNFMGRVIDLCRKGRQVDHLYLKDRPNGSLLARIDVVIDPPFQIFENAKGRNGDLNELMWPTTSTPVCPTHSLFMLSNETSSAIKHPPINGDDYLFDLDISDAIRGGIIFKDSPTVSTGLDAFLKEIIIERLGTRLEYRAQSKPEYQKGITIGPSKCLSVEQKIFGDVSFFQVSFRGVERSPIELAQVQGTLIVEPVVIDAQ